MSRLTPVQFRRSFDAVVEPRDEIVVVYSGIWAFGHQFDLPVRDVPRMLIEQMLEAVGPRRTLLLPAYTYAFTRTRVYSPSTTVPETGVLPQTCLTQLSCVRTKSALNSFLAIGPKSEELGHVVGRTLWGEGSLAALFERVHARIVVLGIPWKDACGFLHRIEEAGMVPYRYHKTFNGRWVEPSESRPWSETMYVRPLHCMPVFRWSQVDERLKARNRILSAPAPIYIESADAADIVSAGLEIIDGDPYALLENAAEIRAWVRDQKGGEISALRAQEPAALEFHDHTHAGSSR